MAAADEVATEKAPAVPPYAILTAYAAAIFLSAALLFAVQPMFTKMVLPRLGGSPSVWSVAMVFFQATLLAGYAYAHLLTRRLAGPASPSSSMSPCSPWRRLALPLAIASGWGRPPTEGETRSGCSACSPSRSGCRSSRCRPTGRCCRPGSRAPIIRRAKDPVLPLRREQCRQLPRADRAIRSLSSR